MSRSRVRQNTVDAAEALTMAAEAAAKFSQGANAGSMNQAGHTVASGVQTSLCPDLTLTAKSSGKFKITALLSGVLAAGVTNLVANIEVSINGAGFTPYMTAVVPGASTAGSVAGAETSATLVAYVPGPVPVGQTITVEITITPTGGGGTLFTSTASQGIIFMEEL